MIYKRKRSQRGLLVCLNDIGEGMVQLTLDDLIKEKEDGSKWSLDVFVTSKDYNKKELKDLNIDEKELADFGYYILNRLAVDY